MTNPFISLKLVDVSSFTKGHHQNYCEIRKQHHINKFKKLIISINYCKRINYPDNIIRRINEIQFSQRVSKGMT